MGHRGSTPSCASGKTPGAPANVSSVSCVRRASRASIDARAGAAPDETRRQIPPRISSVASSIPKARTDCGSWTSPNTRPQRASSTWPSSSTPGADAWWAGRSRTTSALSLSSTRCRWPSGVAVRHRTRRWHIRTTGLSTRLGPLADVCAARGCWVRWERSATVSITPWPSRFGTLQLELLDEHRWTSRQHLALAVFDWIESWYNPKRRHSYCKMLSPVDYEAASAA